MKCKFCGNSFTPKRKTAKYCSPKCRVYNYRNKNSVTKDSVTDKKGVTVKGDDTQEELDKAREEAFK